MTRPSDTGTRPILEIEDLHTTYRTRRGGVKAVDGISLSVKPGETLGIVGESGSGKSVLARSAMGLAQRIQGAEVTGRIEFDGVELDAMDKQARARYWGRDVAMIFQDPMTSLNPVKRIGTHLIEPLRHHLGMSRRDARERGVELLRQVGIAEPARRFGQYPHELSGGMRQRVCIALALCCHPRLLIADEPTTALDVTVQRQILDLLERVTGDTDMATMLITHDLGVVAKRADRVVVMYAGRVVEQAPVRELFHRPRHRYTAALLRAVPRMGDEPHRRLQTMSGNPPNLLNPPVGCRFAARCDLATELCTSVDPEWTIDPSNGHGFACHHPVPVAAPRPFAIEEAVP